MINLIYKLYGYIFGKKSFRKFNNLLYQLSLRGLGILNFQNEYLIGENAWLKKYLKNKINPVVIDVGANVGNYSKKIFDINKQSFVIAFEPHPTSFEKLIKNVIAKKFKAINVAVSDSDGILELYDYDINDGSSHATLYKNVINDLHKGNPISHSVQVIKLDNFLNKENIDKIDLLKIDTEGNEYNVLLGAKSYIETNKIKAIQFEFNEMNIISKVSFKDFWDLLMNYKFYRILPGGSLIEIKNYIPITTEIYAFQNIVAILKT
jgi:FkbM family methyltransferase